MENKKTRNIYRKATTKNFSTYDIVRYILIDDISSTDEEKDKFVKTINEHLWEAIQETNMYAKNRILPFVKVRRVVQDKTKLRIIINDFDSTKDTEDYEVEINDLTHLINFRTLSPQRRVMVSDSFIPGNARMIVDKRDQISAAVDIFLDVAMFNSFSFLSEMNITNKKLFSRSKLNYYNKMKNIIGDNIYYYLDEKEPPSYFSFAFAAREDNQVIDYYKYVELWDSFIREKYPNKDNIIIPPNEQLQNYYIDKDNIEKLYFDVDYWKDYHGDYLFLRTHKKPNTKSRMFDIANYFGVSDIGEYHLGLIRIVPVSEYFNPFLKKQLDELYISAFKVTC